MFFRFRGGLFIPIALLVILLARPTSFSFWAGLPLALLGEILRIWGVGYAGLTTRGKEVQAPFLVTAGPYAYVKNPLYLGNLLIGAGLTLMASGGNPPVIQLLLFVAVFSSYLGIYGVVVLEEEKFLQERFGEEYRRYALQVPRVIPRLSPYSPAMGSFSWSGLTGEKETIILLVVFILLLVWRGGWLPW